MKALLKGKARFQKSIRQVIATFAVLSVAQSANANHNQLDQIIDEPSIILAGSGCSLQNDSLSLLQNGRSAVIAIGFTEMRLEGSSRKSCVLRFPVQIPAGHRLVVSGGEANGYADLAHGDSLAIASYLSVAGATSNIQTKRIHGPAYEDFGNNFSDIFRSRRVVTSACSTQSTSGFIGLNLVASQSSPSRYGFAEVTDVALGVRIVACH